MRNKCGSELQNGCPHFSLSWERIILQPGLVGIFFLCPVNYDCFVDWIAHGPINQAVLFKVGHLFTIETSRISKPTNMFDNFYKKTVVNLVSNDIAMWPGWHRFRESPFR